MSKNEEDPFLADLHQERQTFVSCGELDENENFLRIADEDETWISLLDIPRLAV